MKIELLKKEIYNVLENNRNNDFHVKTITTLAKEIGTSRQSIYDVFNLKNGKIKNNTQRKLENWLAQQQHKKIGKTKIKVYKEKENLLCSRYNFNEDSFQYKSEKIKHKTFEYCYYVDKNTLELQIYISNDKNSFMTSNRLHRYIDNYGDEPDSFATNMCVENILEDVYIDDFINIDGIILSLFKDNIKYVQ